MQKSIFHVLSIATVVALLHATPAFAAQGYYDNQMQNWAGPYAGLNFGGVVGEFTNSPNAVGPTKTAGDITLGLQAGYNWQFGHFVFGGEGDLNWLPISAQAATVGSYDENWMVSLRARMGYEMGRFLPYVTGGLALTETQSNLAAGGSDSDIHAGLAIGGGVDYALCRNWSLRGEYLHADVPNSTSVINSTTFTGGSGNHLFRAAINYHF